MRILVGGDPEILLRRGTMIFPCVGLIPGTKPFPAPVPNSRCGLTTQEDGVALEIGFTPVPVANFRNQIRLAYDETLRAVRETLGREVAFSSSCVHEFATPELIHPQARTLGCDPDHLAHDGGLKRIPPRLDEIGNFRFAGGHIHIGYDKTATPIPEEAIVQFMDLAYLTDLIEGRDRQGERRRFYGIAGLYRKKSYGLEYRTPSNFWFTLNASSAAYWAQMAEHAINKPNFARSIWKAIPWELVQKSINEEKICIPSGDIYNWLDALTGAPNELGDEIVVLDQQEDDFADIPYADHDYEDDEDEREVA